MPAQMIAIFATITLALVVTATYDKGYQLIEGPENRLVFFGGQTEFVCRTDGLDNFIWEFRPFDDHITQSIPNNAMLTSKSEGSVWKHTLTIQNASFQDAGLYFCWIKRNEPNSASKMQSVSGSLVVVSVDIDATSERSSTRITATVRGNVKHLQFELLDDNDKVISRRDEEDFIIDDEKNYGVDRRVLAQVDMSDIEFLRISIHGFFNLSHPGASQNDANVTCSLNFLRCRADDSAMLNSPSFAVTVAITGCLLLIAAIIAIISLACVLYRRYRCGQGTQSEVEQGSKRTGNSYGPSPNNDTGVYDDIATRQTTETNRSGSVAHQSEPQPTVRSATRVLPSLPTGKKDETSCHENQYSSITSTTSDNAYQNNDDEKSPVVQDDDEVVEDNKINSGKEESQSFLSEQNTKV